MNKKINEIKQKIKYLKKKKIYIYIYIYIYIFIYLFKYKYSRSSVARTLMARLPRLFSNSFLSPDEI